MQLLDVPAATGLIGATCIAGDLKAALARVTPFAGVRAAYMPVLEHALLVATDAGGVRVATTDVATHAATDVRGGTAVTPGAATASLKALAEALRGLPRATPVRIEGLANHCVAITSEGAQTVLSGLNPEEMPPAPRLDDGPAAILDGGGLKQAAARVAIAAARDQSRPVLAGLHVVVRGGQATFEAADGFRLARWSMPVAHVADDFDVIVPATAWRHAAALCGMGDVTLRVGPARTMMSVSANDGHGTVIATRLLEGQYPDLQRVIDAMAPRTTWVSVPCNAMAGALAAVRLKASREVDLIEVAVPDGAADGPRTATVALSSRSHLNKTTRETQVAATVTGRETTMALAGKFLGDAFAAAGSPDDGVVTMAMAGPLDPVLVTGGAGVVAVVMPMHRPER